MATYTINFSTNASQITRELNNFQQQINRVARAGQRVNVDFGSTLLPSTDRLSKELGRLQRDAGKISPNTSDWVDLQQKIATVQLEIRKTADAAKAIQLSQNLGAFSPYSLNALETRLELLKLKAKDISPSTTAWREVNKEIQNTEKSIQRITEKPLTLGQRAGAAGGAFLYGGGLGGGIGSAVGGIAGGLAGGVPGAFAGAAIGQAVDNLGQYAAGIAQVVAESNKSRIALAGVTKNVDDYDSAIQSATDASNKFLIPIVDSTRQFTRLQASVAGAGFDTKTTTKVFEGIASAIVATGGSTEDLRGALTATAQVFSKGKVSAEELRQQIGERLPGAFTIFAQSIDKTPQELDKALEKGEVALSDFVKFTEELTRRYGATAETLARAPENAGARLKVALQAATLTFGGFFQTVGAAFQNYFADLIKFAIDNESTIKRVITIFAIGFKTLGGLVGSFAKFLVDTFNRAFSVLLGNLSTVLGRVEDAINRAKGVESLTPQKVSAFQDQARKATEQQFGLKIGSFNTGIIGNVQGAEKFYNQYFNGLVDKATGAAKKTKYTEKIQKILFPEFKPTQFGTGLGRGSGETGAGAGGTGAAKAGKEREKYVSDIANALKREMEERANAIRQDASLSDRERAIQEATMRYRMQLQINRAEYNAAVNDENKKDIINREAYLKDLKDKLDDENRLAQQRFEDVVTSPLRDALDKDRQAVAELEAQNKALGEGYQELTKVQERKLLIDQSIISLDEEQRKTLQPLIDLVLQQAAAVDKLTASQKALKAEQGVTKTIQDLMAQAGQISPRELARLRQGQGFEDQILQAQQTGASPEQIARIRAAQSQVPIAGSIGEQYAKIKGELRDLTEAAVIAANAAQSIGDSFAQSFKDTISGAQTAQQALANFFQRIADSFLDMAAQMIQKWIQMQILKLADFLVPGLGSIAGAASGAFSIGSSFSMAPGTIPGASGIGMPAFTAANGGIAQGGFVPFQAFATGGVVTGPTLGLVGEGRFNEAVVPLPDGKSIPVDLGGAGNNISTNIVINVNNGQAQSSSSGGASDLGRKMEGAVKQVIVNEMRPGGLLSGGRR